jgi:hypothetical protein
LYARTSSLANGFDFVTRYEGDGEQKHAFGQLCQIGRNVTGLMLGFSIYVALNIGEWNLPEKPTPRVEMPQQ